VAVSALGWSLVARDAHATREELPPESDRETTDGYRYAASDVETIAVPIQGTGLVRGRSTVVVHAPLAQVRSAVLEFSRYPEFMPHHRSCRVLGRTSTGGRDVYLEVTAMHGALKMWARVEMQKARIADGVEIHEARMLDGNVKDFKATWFLQQVGDSTKLSLEVFLVPKLPLPNSILNSENMSGSARGVSAMRSRIESTVRGG